MSTNGRTREHVVAWPRDPAARQALEDYFSTVPSTPDEPLDTEQLLGGRELDFTGADLSGLDLAEASLYRAVLRGVRLVGADLYGAWLIETVLCDADLSRCNLRKAKGRHCQARGAILRGADFDRSEFEDSDFRQADLSRAHFGSASFDGADLRGADLRECSFGGLTGLSEARLAGCRVDGATGEVAGPADIGADTPQLADGDELQRWFADHGAPLVQVWRPDER